MKEKFSLMCLMGHMYLVAHNENAPRAKVKQEAERLLRPPIYPPAPVAVKAHPAWIAEKRRP